MSASQVTCPLCQKELGSEDRVLIGQKGADGINNASIERGDDISVAAGIGVHKSCRMNYVSKKDIAIYKKAVSDSTPSVKRSARVSIGPYDSKTDCLFCGNEVAKNKLSADYDDYSCVKTDSFVGKILLHCKTRTDDEWAFTVQGRIGYFGGDLHAADCLYHHSCHINFRTLRDIPMQHRVGPSDSKRKKVGRPKDTDQEQAFLRMCAFFEDNDEEQLTVTDLANKMKEYLYDSESIAYGNQYLKSKLMKHYGESIFVAEGEGLRDIVTFREKTSEILRKYFSMSNEDDEEAQKRAIIGTAAKLIRSDLKTMIKPLNDEYPKATQLNIESALEYIPPSMRCMLQHLFVDTLRKEASIGQSIAQAVLTRFLDENYLI